MVIDEKTKIPLSMVVSVVSGIIILVFAWNGVTNTVAIAQGRITRLEDRVERQEELNRTLGTQAAVMNAKQDTTIERVDRISQSLKEIKNFLMH